MNAEAQLKKWRIKYEVRPTMEVVKKFAKNPVELKTRKSIAKRFPWSVTVWCKMAPLEKKTSSLLLGATREEVLNKAVAHVKKYHFGGE